MCSGASHAVMLVVHNVGGAGVRSQQCGPHNPASAQRWRSVKRGEPHLPSAIVAPELAGNHEGPGGEQPLADDRTEGGEGRHAASQLIQIPGLCVARCPCQPLAA
jgi:hypothetical protein